MEYSQDQVTILLVDDDELTISLTEEMLQHLGYSVLAKTNGMDALEAFLDEPYQFDLILTDQRMPRMTGSELARKILLSRPGIPILLYSGYSEEAIQERPDKGGIRSFLPKPFSMKDLDEAIKRALGQEATCSGSMG